MRRWLMEQEQLIGIRDRLRELKGNSSATTDDIADYVGVKTRSVASWLSPSKPGPMTYEHAIKVAEFFEADVDWLWRGPAEEEPEEVPEDRLSAIEDGMAEIQKTLARLDRALRSGVPEPQPEAERTPQRSAAKGKRRAAG